MKRIIPLLIIPLISLSQIDYQSEIQPIFDANCISCHQGEAAYFGGLALTSYNELIEGGYSQGGIISTGLLENYITTGYMPPYGSNTSLSENEIDLINQWIAEGAQNNNSNLTYVPDDNFEQALIDLGIDEILDDYVSTEIINTLSYIDLSFKGINNLTGIEDFTSLVYFSCSQNNISEINLTNNILLEQLFASNNNLSSINLSNNTLLKILDVSINNINDFDLSNNALLENVNCQTNNISCIQVWSLDGVGENWETDDDVILSLNCEKETLIKEIFSAKKLIQNIDFLGRSNYKSGLKILIYDDGSVEKKYIK